MRARSSLRVPRPALGWQEVSLWVLAGCFLGYALQAALRGEFVDFGIVWRAGNAVLDGQPPYSEVTSGSHYVQSPSSTLLMLPFALLPERLGGQLLTLCNATAIVVGALLAASALAASSRTLAVGMLALSMSTALAMGLEAANIDPLCLLPYGLALLALKRERVLIAGALIGLGLSVKPTMVFFILLPLVFGSIAGTLTAIAVGLITTLVAMPLLPEGSRFVTSVLPFLLEGRNTTGFNHSMAAGIERAGIDSNWALAAKILVLLLLGALFLRYREVLRRYPALFVAVAVVAPVLTTSYFHAHYLVYLGLAVAILDRIRRPIEGVLLALAGYLLLARDVFRSDSDTLDAVLGFRYTAGAIFLIVLVAIILEREARGLRLASAATT
jgi:hypothetical protein